MAVVKRLQEFLESHGVQFGVAPHREAYTSQGVASACHVSGKALAKVVMIKRGTGFVMTVLPAPCKVGMERLEQVFGIPGVSIAHEQEFAGLFPDCDTGAMPPFGNLYGLEVYMDEELTRQPRIAFKAGNHQELLSMSSADFTRLVQPKVAEFCSHS